jgi:hypothetical protein
MKTGREILKDWNRFSEIGKSFKRLKLTQVYGIIGVRATEPGRLRRNPFAHKDLRRSASDNEKTPRGVNKPLGASLSDSRKELKTPGGDAKSPLRPRENSPTLPDPERVLRQFSPHGHCSMR